MRIRLNSTVVHVRHDGEPDRAKEVVVSYNRGGKLYEVRGKACVMACWNMFIPYLAPELPEAQKEALAYAVKGPLVYTSVGVKNWTAWKSLGISNVNCPTMFHPTVALTEAVSLGDLQHAQTPDDPIALHLTKMMVSPGKTRKEQHRLGRAELLATSFEIFERSIRDQLGRILGPGGFDPARDIIAITVNRWPHGLCIHVQQPFRADGVGLHVLEQAAQRNCAPATGNSSPSPVIQTPEPAPAYRHRHVGSASSHRRHPESPPSIPLLAD